MQLDVSPALGGDQLAALAEALTEAGFAIDEPEVYRSAWRRAAAQEAVDGEPEDGYAPSPRSTRGATRA